jgi:hypothetical protein
MEAGLPTIEESESLRSRSRLGLDGRALLPKDPGSAAVPAAVISLRQGQMMRTRGTPLLLLIILVSSFGQSCSQHNSPSAHNASVTGDSRSSPAQPAKSEVSSVGFASRAKLVEHYEKHGREFGSVTIDEYLRKAQELRDRAADGSVVEAARSDGVVTRFDRTSGAFLAFNSDRTIRTFFKPNDGEAYFRRQLNRRD